MSGNTLVRKVMLQIEADDGNTEEKLDRINAAADELAAKHPELKVRIDSAAASAKIGVIRDELREVSRPVDVPVRAKVDKTSLADMGGNLREMLLSPVGLIGAGAAALGPQALGAAAGVTGLAAALGAAAADAGAFGAVAVPMFEKVTAGQQALTAARTRYDDATTNAQRATALHDEQIALQGLTPAEQELAVQLDGLRGSWTSLQDSLQPLAYSALRPWLQTAREGLGFVTPMFRGAAGAIRTLGQDARQELGQPFWKTFFTDLGTAGGITLTSLGQAAGHLGDGIAHLFATFAPDIDKLPPLVGKVAAKFDDWAKSVKSSGLEAFMSKTFSSANVATLKTDLKDLGDALGNVAKATAGLSPAAFGGLSSVLDILAKLSPGQIEAIGILYAVSRTAGGAGNLAKLLTGGAGLSLGGKAAAAEAEAAAKPSAASKVASAAGSAVGVLAVASAADQAFPKGPGGEWMNSWAPYEKIFTNDLPKAYSEAYTHFQRDFAGPMTSWFSKSLPNAFTHGIPAHVWDPAYEGFMRDVEGPVKGWLTGSLPHFFTAAIPEHVWSPGYQGFMRDLGSPIAAWFENSLPHAFNKAGTLLYSAGRDAISGLIGGMESEGSALLSSGEGLVSGLVGSVKGFLHIASPSKVFHEIGRNITAGLGAGIRDTAQQAVAESRKLSAEVAAAAASGTITSAQQESLENRIATALASAIRQARTRAAAEAKTRDELALTLGQGLMSELTGSPAQVKSAVGKLASMVKTEFSSGLISSAKAESLTAWLETDNSALQAAASRRAYIASEITAAKQLAASTASAAAGNYALSGFAASGANGGPASAGQIITSLHSDLTQVKKFTANIRKLAREGLDKNYLAQLIAMGPVQGGPLAQELAGTALSDIKSINKYESQISSVSGQLGKTAANIQYEGGAAAGKGFLAELEAQKKAISSVMKGAAQAMIAELKKELGLPGKDGRPAEIKVNIMGGDKEFRIWLKKIIRITGGNVSVIGA